METTENASTLLEILEAGKKDNALVWQTATETLRDFNDQIRALNVAMHYAPSVLEPKNAVLMGGSVV